MKKLIYSLILFLTVTLSSCQKDDGPIIVPDTKYKHGTFILNEGNMSDGNGSLSFITPLGEITDGVYFKENGKKLGNVCQDMYIANNNIYIISQNGEKNGGEGCLVIADAITLKRKATYGFENFQDNSRPTNIAVIGINVFIMGSDGITLFDEKTETFSLIPNTEGALRNNMAVVGDKLFASAGNSMMVLTPKNGKINVETKKCPGKVGAIIKSSDGNIWLACGGSPSTISKVNAKTNEIIEQHSISEVNLGSYESCTICAKSDIIYMKSEWSTQIWRHIFSKNETKLMVDVKDHIENGNQAYRAINVNPETGYVYVNTIKGYGLDYLTNSMTIWDFGGDTPKIVKDYKNHTSFPAGVYFTASF